MHTHIWYLNSILKLTRYSDNHKIKIWGITIVLKSFQLCSSWKSLNITNSITNLALFIPSHDIKIKLITLLHSNSRFFIFIFIFYFFIELKVATKKKERKKNHARCNKMCRPLPPTKMLRCPQCIKAKINSSIKGRSYLKHLFYFILFFEISFTLANVSSKKKKK